MLVSIKVQDPQGNVAYFKNAWGARELNDRFYRFPILINWIGRDEDEV